MKVTIYHAVSMLDGYKPKGEDVNHAGWRRAYSYDTTRVELEEIFRDNNVVDGDELPVQKETRSLSVGDVVVKHEADLKYHLVEPTGWEELKDERLRAFQQHTTR